MLTCFRGIPTVGLSRNRLKCRTMLLTLSWHSDCTDHIDTIKSVSVYCFILALLLLLTKSRITFARATGVSAAATKQMREVYTSRA